VQKIAIIIGAGPAGLTAAYELLVKTDIKPIILESDNCCGGISRTVEYKGNSIDIGGHRFFSKSDRIMAWWENIMAIQGKPSIDDLLLNRKIPLSNIANAPDPEKSDKVLLIRQRLSRIFFSRRFFDYPVSLSLHTFHNLGACRVLKICFSYLRIRLFPIKNENNLEQFFINRFGYELYNIFFKDYTEIVWGVSCDKISNKWGNQRVKGLSISKTIIHAFKKIFLKNDTLLNQKGTETSLINQFLYPKYGPGQMWSEVANIITSKGGEIHYGHNVIKIYTAVTKVEQIHSMDNSGKIKIFQGDYFFSSMPVSDLITSMDCAVPINIRQIANGLKYRDFMTVGLLLKKLAVNNTSEYLTINNIIPDNWIYIQEGDVKVGRLQIFNNWSPYMVKDLNNVWIGMEYFCNEGDNFWKMPDHEFSRFAISELAKINIIDKNDVLDSVVIRMTKAYPAYFGTYKDFDKIREFTDKISNLFLIGRNGMHRYNNMDHSMLSAITAVENIISKRQDKENIWAVNSEEDFHEEK
jgi:protoporphyrinogen oxidase